MTIEYQANGFRVPMAAHAATDISSETEAKLARHEDAIQGEAGRRLARTLTRISVVAETVQATVQAVQAPAGNSRGALARLSGQYSRLVSLIEQAVAEAEVAGLYRAVDASIEPPAPEMRLPDRLRYEAGRFETSGTLTTFGRVCLSEWFRHLAAHAESAAIQAETLRQLFDRMDRVEGRHVVV